MNCYRVKVPEGARLAGYTVAGRRVPIPPGEYHVHRLSKRAHPAGAREALRFVGADMRGRDVHVPLPPEPHGADPLEACHVEELA
jgi:hypothetical protein